MGFVKVQKNKQYYKRIQTKYRRRREGKTDYYQRRRLVTQDKNKYNTPKYRLVVRITNKKFIAQIVYSTILGDKTLCQQTSTELEKYGAPVGHTSYPAGYQTGLLIARRVLKQIGMDEQIKGVEEQDQEEFHVEDEDNERRPFKVILDVGLIRTLMGSRVFSVLKGAQDGGLHVPHSVKKFCGYEEPEERGMDYTYDSQAHLERILGTHVNEYMNELTEEDPERFKLQFQKYTENDIEPDGVEDMWKECHEKIRESPEYEKEEETKFEYKRNGNKVTCVTTGKTWKRYQKKDLTERKSRVQQKKASAGKRMLAQMGGDDEDEE